MSPAITQELELLGWSVLWGVGLALIYDGIKICRCLWPRRTGYPTWEDLVYGIGAAAVVFFLFFRENQGGLRWFGLAGMIIGSLVYGRLFSPGLRWVLRPLWRGVTFFRGFVENLLKK